MIKIQSKNIEKAVYNLCVKANTEYNRYLYDLLFERFHSSVSNSDKIKYSNILNNIKLAHKTKRPLCQDTGQAIFFVKMGQCVSLEGNTLAESINLGVEKAYRENFFRKSVVKNALFCRDNTDSNTPAIIYTEFTNENTISIDMMIKGAGSENYSDIKMFKPATTKHEIFEFIKSTVISAGEKSCPPLVLGIGVGGTMDYAAVLSKKSFFHIPDNKENLFIQELREYLSSVTDSILDVHLCTSQTHIASLPVAVTINCHSSRHASCVISETNIEYSQNACIFEDVDTRSSDLREISTSDIEAVRSLKNGEHVLLTGEIYTARDAAHEKIIGFYDKHKSLPFEIRDKIIFYAGPCPATDDEVIGPIGPTTSARMDVFCEFMYSNGLLASIGKGERSDDARNTIKHYNGKYLTAQGGIACLLSKCVKKSEVIAFDELQTEAVRKLYVEKFPVNVEY